MSHDVVVITSASSIEHDGVNVPGRVGAILGVISLALIAMGLTIDEWWIMNGPSSDVGLIGVSKVWIGNRHACINPRIELLAYTERTVCLEWEDAIISTDPGNVTYDWTWAESTTQPLYDMTDPENITELDPNATDAPTPSPTLSPSLSPSVSPTLSPTITVPPGSIDERNMCERLGGDSFCRMQFAGWIMNLFAIFSGLIGDINSEKLVLNQYACLGCFICTTLSIICWILLKLIFLDPKFDGASTIDGIGISLWLNVGGAVAAYMAYYLCRADREHYPTTPRFGFMNDGLGPLSRVGALFGFLAWMMLLCASVLPFWSETDQLGSPDHYTEVYLDNVGHATWGLKEFCIGIPISVLNDESYDVCLTYDEKITFTRANLPPRETDGCSLFSDDDNGLDVCGSRLITGIACGIAAFFAIVGDVFSEKSFHNVIYFTIVSIGGTVGTVMWWMIFQTRISGPKAYAAASEVSPGGGVYLCLFGTLCAWVTLFAYLADHCGLTTETYNVNDDGDDDDDEAYVDKNFTCCDCIEELCYGSDIGPFIQYNPAAEKTKKSKKEQTRFRADDTKDGVEDQQPTGGDGKDGGGGGAGLNSNDIVVVVKKSKKGFGMVVRNDGTGTFIANVDRGGATDKALKEAKLKVSDGLRFKSVNGVDVYTMVREDTMTQLKNADESAKLVLSKEPGAFAKVQEMMKAIKESK